MSKRSAFRLGAVMSVAVLAISFTAGAAPASEPSTVGRVVASGSQDIPAGTTITLPDGTAVVLPEAWSDLSIDDLAKLGIHAGMGPSDSSSFVAISAEGSARAGVNALAGEVTPNSASGCNVNVCMQLHGSGLTVDTWNSQAQLSVTMCSFGVYWAAGVIFRTTNQACGSAGTLLEAYGTSTTWPNNTKLCNSWVNIVGKPCNTVHS